MKTKYTVIFQKNLKDVYFDLAVLSFITKHLKIVCYR